MRPTLCGTALTAALLTSLMAGSSQAQSALLDQQPTQKFALLSHVGVEATADNFVIADPNGATVDRFVVYGSWGSGGFTIGDTFSYLIHDNAAGGPPFFNDEPGAVQIAYTGQTPVITPTGNMMPTSSGLLTEYRLDFILPADLVLPAGTYWLELYSEGSLTSTDQFSWGMAAQDPVNGLPCVAWSFNTPGNGWNLCTPFPEKEMALEIWPPAPTGPQLNVTNLVSGSTATIGVTMGTPISAAFVAWSITGGGPTPTPLGPVLLNAPFNLMPLMATDGAGSASMPVAVPPGLVGLPVWMQGYDIGSSSMTNGVALTIG